MSNSFERFSIAVVYFAIHPASEEEAGTASKVHEWELLEPFDASLSSLDLHVGTGLIPYMYSFSFSPRAAAVQYMYSCTCIQLKRRSGSPPASIIPICSLHSFVCLFIHRRIHLFIWVIGVTLFHFDFEHFDISIFDISMLIASLPHCLIAHFHRIFGLESCRLMRNDDQRRPSPCG